MREAIVVEYVELCEQIAASESLDEVADQALYGRLDQLWHVEMAENEQFEAEDRMVEKARAWHDAHRAKDPRD